MRNLLIALVCFITLAFVSSTGARMGLPVVAGDPSSACTWYSAYQTTITGNSGSTGDRARRSVISAASISGDATTIRITVDPGSSNSDLDGCSVCTRSGSTMDCVETPIRITWDGGSSTTTITASTPKTSDAIDVSGLNGGKFDDDNNYLFHFWWDDGFQYAYNSSAGDGVYTNNTNPGADETLTADVTDGEWSLQAGWRLMIEEIEECR